MSGTRNEFMWNEFNLVSTKKNMSGTRNEFMWNEFNLVSTKKNIKYNSSI